MHSRSVCALLEWSFCFLQSCGGPVIKSHWPSQSGSLGIPGLLPDAWAGKPDVGPKAFTAVTDLQWGRPPGGCELCFCCDCTPPAVSLWLLLCPGKWRVFFLVGSSVLLLMVVEQLIEILVFLQEKMSSHPFTLLEPFL